MGFLDRILGPKPDPVAMLEEAIERLQVDIVRRLIADYSRRLELADPSEAVSLASCVLSYATIMPPIDERAKQYYDQHADLVRQQALELAGLPHVAESFSYLFAAITLLLAIRRAPWELANQLGARATELSFRIPNTYDICGSADAGECIRAIAAFAAKEETEEKGVPQLSKEEPEPRPSFQIDAYVVDMVLREDPSLREFSSAEYKVFRRVFVGEKIYHAPDVEFAGRLWKLTLGVVQGKLYKIAPFLELKDKAEANKAALDALTFCIAQLGKPAQQRTGFFVWDKTDGNVILQTVECADGFAVNLFVTSSAVRSYEPL